MCILLPGQQNESQPLVIHDLSVNDHPPLDRDIHLHLPFRRNSHTYTRTKSRRDARVEVAREER